MMATGGQNIEAARSVLQAIARKASAEGKTPQQYVRDTGLVGPGLDNGQLYNGQSDTGAANGQQQNGNGQQQNGNGQQQNGEEEDQEGMSDTMKYGLIAGAIGVGVVTVFLVYKRTR
jgi:hypothetical protein